MRASSIVCFVLLGTIALASARPSNAQSASPSAAKDCAENAMPQYVAATKAKGDGYLYTSVCVRPYKPDPAYAKHQTPVGETRDGLSERNADPLGIIQMAYGSDIGEVFGAPDWLSAQAYDFEAKMDAATADALEKLSTDDRKLARQHMLQALLADQFKLEVHREIRQIAAYNLVVAEGGPKFHEEAKDPRYPNGMCYISELGAIATIHCESSGIYTLRGSLKFFLRHPVIDKTGLNGFYVVTLQFRTTPDTWVRTHLEEAKDTLPWAIVDQLGLFLEPVIISAEVTVIDHVEKPRAN